MNGNRKSKRGMRPKEIQQAHDLLEHYNDIYRRKYNHPYRSDRDDIEYAKIQIKKWGLEVLKAHIINAFKTKKSETQLKIQNFREILSDFTMAEVQAEVQDREITEPNKGKGDAV